MLTALPDDLFDGLTGLDGLDTSCNGLTALNLNLFNPFSTSLTDLDIRRNNFTNAPTDAALRAKLTNIANLYIGDEKTCRGDPAVSFGSGTYTAAEGDSVTVTVNMSAAPTSAVTIPITAANQGGASNSDYSVPPSVTFATTETSKTFTFTATDDVDNDRGESVLLGFGTLPVRVNEGEPSKSTVNITDNYCTNQAIWCATLDLWEGTSPGAQRLYLNQIDNDVFTHNGVDYWLADIKVTQNSDDAPVDDINIKWQHGYPERTRFDLRIHSPDMRANGHEGFLTNKDEWLDWTLHVSTVSDGETTTTELRLSEARLPLGSCCLMFFGRDIDDLRRTWQPGQIYELRLVEDPRSDRTPQPLNPPMYLGINEEVARLVPDAPWLARYTFLEWIAPQGRDDLPPPVDSYKVQWKQTSSSWDTDADVSETITGPGHRRYHSYDLDGLTPGVEYNIRVIATDSVGDSEPSNEITYSLPAAAQQSLSNTPAEGEPRIDGTPEAGQTLSAVTTGITDADGLNEVVFQYRWLADNAEVDGATGSTYTLTSGDEGRAITVRVDFTDDVGNEESLTSAPTVVTAAGLQLRSATVDGATLTLTYDEDLDNSVFPPSTAFAVNVNGESRTPMGVAVGQSNVVLLLSQAVEAADTVTVDYTAPDDTGFIQDTRGRKAASFSGQAVTNNTAASQEDTARDAEAEGPLTATIHDEPSSHDGQTAFTFELRFSETPKPDFSYTTVRDHTFTVTGGAVTYVRRLEPGKNVRWEITVTPGSNADVAIALNATTDCSAQGAICTEDGGKLAGGLQLVVPGPNTPATGAPTITGAAQVGETLTADTSGISDDDGLDYAAFAYQWLADDAEINGANASSYTLVAADEGNAIKVRVSFTDDAGNDEELTSAGTAAVAAAPPPLNTPAIGLPTISGTAQVGETLTADTTGISDDDGLGNANFAYQWLADDAEINGATASAYTLAGDDEGKAVKVRVSFTDDAGNYEALTSQATAAVAEAAPTGPPPAPQNLTAVVNGDGQIVLSWEAPGDDSITGYQILRRRPTEGEDTLLVYVADTQSAATTYTDTNVTQGVQHAYRVKAINAVGLSRQSNFVNVTP